MGIYGKRERGHTMGTVMREPLVQSGKNEGTTVQYTVVPIGPRLLDLHVSARYLGLSAWTVRTLEQQGILKRIRVPLPNNGELRKLLFDRQDLDNLINAWKTAP